MNQPRHRVLIGVGQAALRSGMSQALRQIAECEVADGSDAAIDVICQHRFDMCFLDADREGNWTDTMKLIQQVRPGMPVILMSHSPNEDEFREVMRSGAAGYQSVAVDAAQLVRVVENVLKGQATMSLALIRGLIDDGGYDSRNFIMADQRLVSLSHRESVVLKLLRNNLGTNTIARQLNITPTTVRRHKSSLLAKFGASSVEDLLAQIDGDSLAVRSG